MEEVVYILLQLQYCICPGVFPKSLIYFPLTKFNTLQIGSLGTLTKIYFLETLNSSFKAFSGSSKCSRTSLATTKSYLLSSADIS